MTTTIKQLFSAIDALSKKERMKFEREYDRRLEREFRVESRKAARHAKKRNIDMAAIDRAIEQMRYGK